MYSFIALFPFFPIYFSGLPLEIVFNEFHGFTHICKVPAAGAVAFYGVPALKIVSAGNLRHPFKVGVGIAALAVFRGEGIGLHVGAQGLAAGKHHVDAPVHVLAQMEVAEVGGQLEVGMVYPLENFHAGFRLLRSSAVVLHGDSYIFCNPILCQFPVRGDTNAQIQLAVLDVYKRQPFSPLSDVWKFPAEK